MANEDVIRGAYGSLGTVQIRLAQTPRPYRHWYADAVDERRDIAGTDTRAEARQPKVREWKIDDWTGGFGNPNWRSDEPNTYNVARSVCPDYRAVSYGGLVLGPSVATAAGDTPSTFTPSTGRLFRASNVASTALTMWAPKTRALHPWLPSSDVLDDTAVTVGAVGGDVLSVADCGDGYLYCVDDTDNDVYQVDADAPANVLHWDRSAAATPRPTAPIHLAAHRGEVYMLGAQGDLHLLDRSTTNSHTRVVDAFYPDGATVVDAPWRIVSTDVGLTWFHATRLGVDIWEYNVAEDSSSIVATIEAPASPWSINFIDGFTFVAYTLSSNTEEQPNVYVYYFREGQSGTLGPFTDVAEAYFVNLPGKAYGRFVPVIIGEYFTPTNPWDMFVYDLAVGARHHWARGVEAVNSSPVAVAGVMVGRDLLVSTETSGGALAIEHVDLEEYNTSTAGDAYLDTGRYDFDLPGTEKHLVDITVVTDPLPANTSIQLQYSLDGDAFAGSGLDITTDGATVTTFSLATSNLTFRELELRIMLNSTTTSATPTVRSVAARAYPISVQEYWDLDIDLDPQDHQVSGDDIYAETIIANLVALKTAQATVTFTYPWEVEEGTAAQSDTVYIVSVQHPDIGGQGQNRYASVRLMRAGLS